MKTNKTAVDAFCLILFLLLLAGTSHASEIYDFNPGWMFMHSDKQIAPLEYKVKGKRYKNAEISRRALEEIAAHTEGELFRCVSL